MWNINAHCILGYRRKMSEIIQLIRYENNERLGSNCLSDQNDSVISVNPDIALYPSTRIYRGSDLRTPRTAFLITGFHCIPVESIEPSTKQQILDSSELKEFADDNFECTENYRTFSK